MQTIPNQLQLQHQLKPRDHLLLLMRLLILILRPSTPLSQLLPLHHKKAQPASPLYVAIDLQPVDQHTKSLPRRN